MSRLPSHPLAFASLSLGLLASVSARAAAYVNPDVSTACGYVAQRLTTPEEA